MPGFFKRKRNRIRFDRKTLRRNDISILTLDERWNSLFSNIEKTSEIQQCEEQLKELLKEQARLTAEFREIAVSKKKSMDRILYLTTEAFDNQNDEAKKEMRECEQEILRINERLKEIEQRQESIPDSIRETNLHLLEHTVNLVYFKIRIDQQRVKELGTLIEEERARLKAYIEEKEILSQDSTDIYSYFHDLLGGAELERLDREFFA